MDMEQLAATRMLDGRSGMSMRKYVDEDGQYAKYLSVRYRVPGLRNLGNTCFFNAILQTLAGMESFHEYLAEVEENTVDFDHAKPFSSALKHCMDALVAVPMHEECKVVAPERLNFELCRQISSFRGSKQQDAQELLQFLMSLLDKEQQPSWSGDTGLAGVVAAQDCFLSESISDSRFEEMVDEDTWNPLFGLQYDELRCSICDSCRPKKNRRFLDISLSFADDRGISKKSLTLEDCIEQYKATEVVSGVECSRCTCEEELSCLRQEVAELQQAMDPSNPNDELVLLDMQEALRSREEALIGGAEFRDISCSPFRALRDFRKCLQFARLPDVLCFHFNRKIYQAWGGSRKVETHVDFPLELEMAQNDVVAVSSSSSGNMNGFSPIHTQLQKKASSTNGTTTSRLWTLNGASALQDSKTRRTILVDYELVGVVLHHGNERGGHFTSFRRVRASNQWFFISDDVVREVSENQVLQSAAYMLFYERKYRHRHVEGSDATVITANGETISCSSESDEEAKLETLCSES